MTIETLARGDVDVWISTPKALDDPALRAAYATLLTEAERVKLRAFHFEKNRRESLLTRALVRTTLSRYRSTEPAAWRFVQNRYGRPYLDPPCGLFFNLSNHPSMVVCAVTEGVEVGVDVEPFSRAATIVGLARSVFAPEEREELARLDEPARLDRAATLWTLKESYIKARGKGLSLPLDAFAFHFRASEPQIAFHASIDDHAERWWFRTFAVAEHRIAVTVERAGPVPPVVRLRPCLPLRDSY